MELPPELKKQYEQLLKNIVDLLIEGTLDVANATSAELVVKRPNGKRYKVTLEEIE